MQAAMLSVQVAFCRHAVRFAKVCQLSTLKERRGRPKGPVKQRPASGVLTETDVIAAVALESLGVINIKQATLVVSALLKLICREVVRNERQIVLPGFGIFSPCTLAALEKKHSRSGVEQFRDHERRALDFRPSSLLSSDGESNTSNEEEKFG